MWRRGREHCKGELVPGFVLLIVLICAWGVTTKGADANQPSAIDGVLATVRDCMTQHPAPWPQAWKQEYLDTIRQAVAANPDVSEYARRLQILRDGFALYWPQVTNARERSFFEVRRAEIRWYVEILMNSSLPGEEDTQAIRRQYEDFANHGAEGLLTQFSFLDPNGVHEAKANYLADCYRRIDAPLLPIFRMPLSVSQMEEIKERWYDLRYARIDLWRQLDMSARPAARDSRIGLEISHCDYTLMRRSLDAWETLIWGITLVVSA